MKKTILAITFSISISLLFGQGLLNNGANIVLANNAHVVIADNTNGNYKTQGNGVITSTSISSSGTIHVNADWINENSSSVGFSNDGATVILEGANQNISGTQSTTFYNLTLDGSGTKTLGINTKVGGLTAGTGVLALNDRTLLLNEKTLEVTNGATNAITRSSGKIISEHDAAINTSIVQWNTTTYGNYEVPFGTNDGLYIPLTLSKTSSGNNNIQFSTRPTVNTDNQPWANNFGSWMFTDVSHFKADPSCVNDDCSEDLVIDRWYQIDPSTTLNADITFSYKGSENTTTIGTGPFSAFRWRGSPSGWEGWQQQSGSNNGVTSGIGNVLASGVSDFGAFVLSSFDNPLPVKLTQFAATCLDGSAQITWTTESEQNSDYFAVEGSRDGFNWVTLGTVNAAGNSSHTLHYSFEDDQVTNGINYYRLRQVDYDGSEDFYGPISTSCMGVNGPAISVYPNPASGQFTLAVSINQTTEATIQLVDATGKIVELRNEIMQEGNNQYLFDASRYAKGTYSIRVISEDNLETQKIVLF